MNVLFLTIDLLCSKADMQSSVSVHFNSSISTALLCACRTALRLPHCFAPVLLFRHFYLTPNVRAPPIRAMSTDFTPLISLNNVTSPSFSIKDYFMKMTKIFCLLAFVLISLGTALPSQAQWAYRNGKYDTDPATPPGQPIVLPAGTTVACSNTSRPSR